MAQWGNVDQQADAPIFALDAKASGTPANAAYGNTTVDAVIPNVALGIFGVDAAETVNAAADAVTHAGWIKRVAGTGPVSSIAIANNGTGYDNTDVVVISGGTANGAGTLTTDGSGGLLTVTLTDSGAGFVSTAATTAALANSTGGTATGTGGIISFTLGGRANRVQMETLVAMGSMTGDGSDDALFPDA